MIKRLLLILRVLPALGFGNILRIAIYRAGLRSGLFRRRLPVGLPIAGPFFVREVNPRQVTPPFVEDERRAVLARAERVLSGALPFYSDTWRSTGFPPAWGHDGSSVHWTELDEFAGGDIKDVWEPSRFDGLLFLTQAACLSDDPKFLEAIESWLSCWSNSNPWNAGPNWRCAQEAGLRLMTFVVCCDILHRFAGLAATDASLRFIREHARRIAPTMLYAIAQDNNHATSEAVALFIAGSFLAHAGHADRESERWCASGRRHLEARVARLIMADGAFAQHSVNYHRLMLDTLCLAELWRRKTGRTQFSAAFYLRLTAATDWLAAMLDPLSGDAPNLGANDGARFLPMGDEGYRDFRPTVVLAARLFKGCDYQLPSGEDARARWLSVGSAPGSNAPGLSAISVFPEGGYVVVRLAEGRLILRLPRYRFRPSHADALHVDLWWRGRNLLCDGGTYSYNAQPDPSAYFAGTASHNTVQFDDRDQMPRIGRFLFGAWLDGDWEVSADGEQRIVARYTDSRGAKHIREIQVDGGRTIRIVDTVAGNFSRAIVRWRTTDSLVSALGDGWSAPEWGLRFSRRAHAPLNVTHGVGRASRYYARTDAVSVVEAVLTGPDVVETTILLN